MTTYTEEQLKNIYKDFMLSATFDRERKIKRTNKGRLDYKKVEKLLIKHKKVFDVGAAGGFFLQAFKEHGWQVDGSELSHPAIKYAWEHFDIRLRYGFFKDTVSEAGLFVFWNTIEHLPDPVGAIELVKQYTPHNGQVYTNIPLDDPAYPHVTVFTQRSIAELFKGFMCLYSEHNKGSKPEYMVQLWQKKIDAKWYEENYTPWMERVNSKKDLFTFHDNRNARYRRRHDHWFSGVKLEGVGLELGFNNGKTLRWLDEKYSIEMHGIDFNPSLKKIIPYLREIKAVSKLSIVDVLKYRPKEKYSFIICLDFIEHLYRDDYLKMLPKVKGWLKDGGRIYVFGGYAKQVEHVNVSDIQHIEDDFIKAGFKAAGRVGFPETGDHLQIFKI